MNITATMVKELRERTGSGMMECKKALVAAEGNLDVAVEQMRKSGLAKADKKSGRTAAEGSIFFSKSSDGRSVVMLEINCETDFVAKGDDFKEFSMAVANAALNAAVNTLDEVLGLLLVGGESVEESRLKLVAKIGEHINVRRFERYANDNAHIGNYLHGTRIGVLLETSGGSDELRKDIAMHIAASNPECVSEENVSAEIINREKEIYLAQARESGKPDNIIEKMVEGRLKKFLGEITLLGQPFVKDPDIKIAKLLSNNDTSVVRFIRFEVGEGIEKKEENFAEEVMAQVQGH